MLDRTSYGEKAVFAGNPIAQAFETAGGSNHETVLGKQGSRRPDPSRTSSSAPEKMNPSSILLRISIFLSNVANHPLPFYVIMPSVIPKNRSLQHLTRAKRSKRYSTRYKILVYARSLEIHLGVSFEITVHEVQWSHLRISTHFSVHPSSC